MFSRTLSKKLGFTCVQLIYLCSAFVELKTAAEKVEETLQFNGSSFISFNITSVAQKQFQLGFRFKFQGDPGTLLRSSGNSLGLNVKQNKVRLTKSQGVVEVQSVAIDTEREWHEVMLSSDGSTLVIMVDDVTLTVQDKVGLALGQTVFLGGDFQDSTNSNRSRRNFIGCMQRATLNGLALFGVTQAGSLPVTLHGAVVSGCSIPVKHVTFTGENSYLRIPSVAKGDNSVYSAAFDLRTFDTNATLLFVDMGAGVNITIDLEDNVRLLAIYMNRDHVVRILYELYTGLVITPADGEWHRLSFELNNSTGLTMTLDKWAIVDEKIKSAARGDNRTFFLGGIPDSMGFKGCMRGILIDGTDMDLSRVDKGDVVMATLGRCDLPNSCGTESCYHGGQCYQTRTGFSCNCSDTGYTGAVCHTPLYVQSCDLVEATPDTRFHETVIDVDGSGPAKPLPVICHKESPNHPSQTIIQTTSTENTTVDGFESPGSFSADIFYSAGINEISSVIDRATSCRQFIEYNCSNSRLLSRPDSDEMSYGWWVGRDNQSHVYWGGAKPNSGDCACAKTPEGCAGGKSCNCDAGVSNMLSDSGYLDEKSHLPITQVRFGDTGKVGDGKHGTYRVGPLVCQGDQPMENMATFNKLGSWIHLPVKLEETPVDFWFQFKTGIRRAYLLHSKGSSDNIDGQVINELSLRLSGSYSLVVDFILNKQRTVLNKVLPFRLNDNNWHSVYLEFNVKEVTISVDGESSAVWEAEGWTEKLAFVTEKPLVIGNSLNGTNGFLGCMRGLMINGRAVDVGRAIERHGAGYGVHKGCQGKCDDVSNPCLNKGQCQDYYATYMCDCSKTPYTGCYCGLDLGANIKSDGGVMVRLDQRLIEEEREFRVLRFGFKTLRHLGVLAHITNAHPGFPDFISIELRNDGLVVYLDVGHGEAEIKSSAGAVNDGRVHYVTLTYNKTEEELILKVDDTIDLFNLTRTPPGVDTVLDTPKRLYIARVARTVPGAGFEGCIFRLMYNDHPVLQDVFLNPTPSHVFLVGRGKIRRSSCGLSENVPGEIRQLHAPQKLPKGNQGKVREPPLITNFTSRISMKDAMKLEPSHVMAGFQEISCGASGVPLPIFTWLKDGGPLSCPHLIIPGGKLLMPEDDRLDGSYQCVAHNVNGRAISDKVAFESPRITRLRATRRHKLVIREGGYLRLECSEHVDSVPATTITWFYDNKIANNTRIFQSPTGALNILPVLRTDAGTNFTCVKTNELLDVSIKVKVITLTVIATTETAKSSPVETKLVYMTPPPLTIFLGQNLRLECLLKGKNANELTWHRENSTSDTTRKWIMESKGRQLLVSNVSEEDEGWYLCSTKVATYARYFVDITSPPLWVKAPQPTKAYRGSDAHFWCISRSTSGEPKPRTPRWLKNGKRLQGDDRHVISQNGTELTIKNVSKGIDFQTIQCNVSNHRGYSFAEAFLDIIEPLVINRHPEEVSVVRGETVSIHVDVTLDDTLDATFTWLKTDQHIGQLKTPNSDPTEIFTVTSTREASTLTLNTNHIADDDVMSYTGYYVCVIGDGVGEKITKGKIVITLPLEPPPGDDSAILWGLAIAITLGVIFIGVVIGIICFTRRRKRNRQDKVAELPLKCQRSSLS